MSEEAEFNRKVEADIDDLNRRNRAARRRNLLLVLVTILAILFGLVAVWLAQDNQRLADANAQYGAKQAQEKQTIAKEAQKALCGTKDSEIYDKAICEKLADAAQEPPPPPAEPVAAGPSQEDLVKAFRAYCAEGNNCKGKDGAAPTADDIALAFVKFCSDGRCRGADGKDAPPGKDGTDGQNGTNGKDGVSLPPPPEMVLAAITQYCVDGRCRGADGAPGADGKPGPGPTDEAILAAVQKVCAENACDGPPGKDGRDGTNGVDGKDGATGPPPSQFSFTWAGTTYSCTPNPPGSTTYACDPVNSPPPVIGVGP
jgi:hypothetical protein